MQAFVAEYLRSSLINDAQANPRPMTAYAESPAGISGLFNYVSYGKGMYLCSSNLKNYFMRILYYRKKGSDKNFLDDREVIAP